jgi:hypothetical protein
MALQKAAARVEHPFVEKRRQFPVEAKGKAASEFIAGGLDFIMMRW